MKQNTKQIQNEKVPEGWKIKKVGDLCNIRRGASPRPIQNFLSNKGMPWIKISDATASHSRFIDHTEHYIKEEGISHSVSVFPGDLILSNSATPGLPKFLTINACIHDGWLLLRDLTVDKNFLYYFLLNEREKICAFASGSVFRNLKTDILRDHAITLPKSRSEQKLIAKILSDLDTKIELNNKMNKALETIGHVLFKKWFIDEGKKEWKEGKLDEVLETIESGKRPKGGIDSNLKQGIPSIGAENINGLGYYDYSSTKFIEKEFFNSMKTGKIKSGDVLLYKDGAKIGRKSLFMNEFPFKECCVNEHVFILRSKEEFSQYFLYFWLDQKSITEKIINLNGNAAQPGINQPGVLSLSILIPDKDSLNHFDSFVEFILSKIFDNCLQNRNLSKIRDILLPKLMSGEIRVK